MAPTHALLLERQYAAMILNGMKDWEIRGRSTSRRETISLAATKTGLLLGEIDLIGCRQVGRWDPEQQQLVPWRDPKDFIGDPQNYHHHRIENLDWVKKYRTVFAWELARPKWYETPVAFTHTPGAMIWLKLDAHRKAPTNKRGTNKKCRKAGK